jgi:hypothetical protein
MLKKLLAALLVVSSLGLLTAAPAEAWYYHRYHYWHHYHYWHPHHYWHRHYYHRYYW